MCLLLPVIPYPIPSLLTAVYYISSLVHYYYKLLRIKKCKQRSREKYAKEKYGREV
jgi:hypothetical protein